MRTVRIIALALVGGFLGGIVLSAIIGIAGVLLFDRAIGVRFLPLYLAAACAGAAPVVDALVRCRAGAPGQAGAGRRR